MSLVPTIPKLTLFSVLPIGVLISNFEAGNIAKPSNKSELQILWKKADQEYQKLDGSRTNLTSDDVKTLQLSNNDKIIKMENRLKKYPPYDIYPFGIYDVKISKLITPQLTVNLNRAEKRTKLKENMSMDDLFDLMFDVSQNKPEIIRQVLGLTDKSGLIQFTSYDEDIRVHIPPHYVDLPVNTQDSDSLNLETTSFLVGGGYSFANAYKINVGHNNTKLILSNGIHRVYRLAIAGYERVPLPVIDITPKELPNPFVDFKHDTLMGKSPPLLIDFLNKNVIIPLEYFTQLKTLRFSWNIESYTTVLK